MARRLGDEDDEYGLDEEGEHHSLIELSEGGRATSTSRHAGAGTASSGASGGSSATCRWATVLFLLALAGVYHLGLQEGKNEVQEDGGAEDVTRKEPWHQKVLGPKGGGGEKGEGGVDAPAPGPASPPKPAEPTPPPTSRGSFTADRLKSTREECLKVTALLEEYYSGKEQATKMLMNPWVAPWDFDSADEEKRLRADKLVDTMVRALVTDDQTKFLMGGIGSSVMAGHDNCRFDSYESQMERLWKPVWEAAGMEFEFQNAGEGGGCGDSFENQHFCVKQVSCRRFFFASHAG